MTQQDKRQDADAGNVQRADPGRQQRAENRPANRSESLLPGEDTGDGRFEVAEEVNLDQQSDMLRRVGKPPKDLPKP